MYISELRSCVKVEVAVLGFLSLIVLVGLRGHKATLNLNSYIIYVLYISVLNHNVVILCVVEGHISVFFRHNQQSRFRIRMRMYIVNAGVSVDCSER